MVALRVNTILSGPGVIGGGINQMFFSNGAADAQACTDAVQDFWDALAAQMSNQINYQTDTVVAVFNETDGQLLSQNVVTALPLASGLLTNHMLPTSTQGLIRLGTNGIVHNRQVRGRVFVPGMVEDNNFSPGVPGGSWPSVAQAAINALIADATADLAVWSRPVTVATAGVPIRNGSIHDVTAATVWDKWAVLRSRRD